MKSFKRFINEREQEAYAIISALKSGGDFTLVNSEGQLETYERTKAGLEEYIKDAYNAKPFGSGFFSVVSAGPVRDFVMKITRSRDEEYLNYATLSQRYHSRNDMFPRVIHIDAIDRPNTFSGNTEQSSVFIIEAVDVPKYQTVSHEFIDMLRGIAYKEIYGIELKRVDIQNLMNKLSEYQDKDKFLDWCRIMKIEFGDRHIGDRPMIDIKHANLGFRKDGSLVMLDPVA